MSNTQTAEAPELEVWTRRPDFRLMRGHPGDSGLDLQADLQDRDGSTFTRPIKLRPHEQVLIGTGIHVAVPAGYEIQVRSRGSIASKGIIIANSPGTVDSGYRGEIMLTLINLGYNTFEIEDGMRIAQMVMCPVVLAEPQYVESLEDLGTTSRGEGRFGSTGMF